MESPTNEASGPEKLRVGSSIPPRLVKRDAAKDTIQSSTCGTASANRPESFSSYFQARAPVTAILVFDKLLMLVDALRL